MPQVFSVAAYALLSALFAAGQSPANPPAQIGIFMDFESSPGAVSVQEMEREVDRLLEATGLALDWHLTSDNQGTHSFDGLVLFKFKGICRAGNRADIAEAVAGEIEVLGSTKTENGRVLPFSEVECDQVRKTLSYLSPEAGQNERQRAMGLAMGRVVAHELYHVLARTTEHAAKGMAKRTHSLEELISAKTMSFGPADSRAMAAAAAVRNSGK